MNVRMLFQVACVTNQGNLGSFEEWHWKKDSKTHTLLQSQYNSELKLISIYLIACLRFHSLKIKHEYLRSRAYICLSLSSPFSSSCDISSISYIIEILVLISWISHPRIFLTTLFFAVEIYQQFFSVNIATLSFCVIKRELCLARASKDYYFFHSPFVNCYYYSLYS